jgi:hypothetical protein
VFLLVLGHLEYLSSSTGTQVAFNPEYHSKPTVLIRECSPKVSSTTSRVLVVHLQSFTQTLIFPSIEDKMKHKVEEAPCKNNTISQCGVTWQTDAIGLQKCDFRLPSSSFTKATVKVWKLSDTTYYMELLTLL